MKVPSGSNNCTAREQKRFYARRRLEMNPSLLAWVTLISAQNYST